MNLTESEFEHAHITFLEYVVGQREITPVMAKVEAITSFPAPQRTYALSRYMAGYYRKFCRNFSTITAPLTNLLKKQEPFNWTPECQEAFDGKGDFVVIPSPHST